MRAIAVQRHVRDDSTHSASRGDETSSLRLRHDARRATVPGPFAAAGAGLWPECADAPDDAVGTRSDGGS